MITVSYIKNKRWNSFQEFYNKGFVYSILSTPIYGTPRARFEKRLVFRYNKRIIYSKRINKDQYLNFIRYLGLLS